MGWYIFKLMLLLPLLGGLIWGSLRAAKWMQGRLNGPERARMANIVETTIISPGMRLAVIEFKGRHILIGTSRGRITRLAEAPASYSRAGTFDGYMTDDGDA